MELHHSLERYCNLVEEEAGPRSPLVAAELGCRRADSLCQKEGRRTVAVAEVADRTVAAEGPDLDCKPVAGELDRRVAAVAGHLHDRATCKLQHQPA